MTFAKNGKTAPRNVLVNFFIWSIVKLVDVDQNVVVL